VLPAATDKLIFEYFDYTVVSRILIPENKGLPVKIFEYLGIHFYLNNCK
jgi:hypothetical protein